MPNDTYCMYSLETRLPSDCAITDRITFICAGLIDLKNEIKLAKVSQRKVQEKICFCRVEFQILVDQIKCLTDKENHKFQIVKDTYSKVNEEIVESIEIGESEWQKISIEN